MAELVTVARFIDRAEAMIARSLLQSEGLSVVMPEENVLSTLPHLILGVGGYRLMVRAQNAELARVLLRDAQLGHIE